MPWAAAGSLPAERPRAVERSQGRGGGAACGLGGGRRLLKVALMGLLLLPFLRMASEETQIGTRVKRKRRKREVKAEGEHKGSVTSQQWRAVCEAVRVVRARWRATAGGAGASGGNGARAEAVLGPGFLPEVVAGPCLSSACSAELPPVPTKGRKRQVLSLGQSIGGIFLSPGIKNSNRDRV